MTAIIEGTVAVQELNRDTLIQLTLKMQQRIDALERERVQLLSRHRVALQELAKITKGEIAFYYEDERSSIRSGGNGARHHQCSACGEDIARGDLVHYINEGLLQHVTC